MTEYAVLHMRADGTCQPSSWHSSPADAVAEAERRNDHPRAANEFFRAVSTEKRGYFTSIVPGETLYA